MTPTRLETIQDAPRVDDDALQQLVARGVAGCRARDAHQVRDVFIQLAGALNFDYEDAARRLFAIYEDCIRAARHRRFEEPLRILEYLHAAWTPVPAAVPRRPS